MKEFNVTGTCFPHKHYMVDISENLDAMQKLVDKGMYFTVNRGRQYGKTTTLSLLRDRLESIGYAVFFISFEGLGDEEYKDFSTFYHSFFGMLADMAEEGIADISERTKEILHSVDEIPELDSRKINRLIGDICKAEEKKIVILIDEVDSAGNHSIFLKFLGMLRARYLKREESPTFHSVILAGVYDIKNLKLKMRSEEEHQYNSPWNIAVGFDKDMSLQESGIAGMLKEYEADHSTGMDVSAMAKRIRDYTSGYPFLVSRLCQIMDEEGLDDSWTAEGFQRAVKEILGESNTLFDDLAKKLDQYPELHDMLYNMLYTGRKYPYTGYEKELNIATMFGYIVPRDGKACVGNRIFEIWMYNLFVVEASRSDDIYKNGSLDRSQFVKDGILDMRRVLERFVEHYTDIYGDKDERFHEKEGRKFFLFYLKPIINGTGNFYVEAETLDEGRMDVVVDYLGRQYVIELKIWRGPAYHEEGEQQLSAYLDSMHLDHGYMLTFNFNQKKYPGVKEVEINGKQIYEAVV